MKKHSDYYLGYWLVLPSQNLLKKAEKEVAIEPKLMDVLVCMSNVAPEVVSSNQIINICWPNQYLSDNPVHKSIAQIRKALGDSAKNPSFIKTVPKKGYAIIADIRGLNKTPSFHHKPWIDGSPYPGLHHYEEKHAQVYFGRSKASSEIKYLINQLQTHKQLSFLLFGASGVGKTSLMKTNILPYIKNPDRPFKFIIAKIYQPVIPIQKTHSFLQSFIIYLQDQDIIEPVFDQARQVETIRNNPCNLGKILKTSTSQDVVDILFIDQLERIFVEKNQNQNEISLFFKLIQEIINSHQFFVIIVLKHEYYSDVMRFEEFEQIRKQSIQYDLLPPTLSEITEIVNLPVAAAGINYEFDTNSFESLNNTIISEAQNIGNVLPILSHTLSELCCDLNENNEISFKSYYKMGKLMGSFANKVDEIYILFSKPKIQSFRNNLHLLIQFASGNANKLFCAKVELQQFHNSLSQEIITYLIEAHLLHVELIHEKSYVSVIHESLLNESQFFKSWVNENQLNLSIIYEVHILCNQWYKNKQKSDYLLKNKYLLQQSCEILQKNALKFESNERNFIQKSVKKYKKKQHLKSLAIIGLIFLLIISLSLLWQHQKLNIQLNTAQQEAEKLLSYMLEELNKKLRPIGKLDLLDDIGGHVLKYYAVTNNTTDSVTSVLHRVEALNTLGEVEVKKGHIQQALQYFFTAIEQYEPMSKALPTNTQLMFKISQTHYWLGYIHFIDNKTQLTEKHWLNYLNLTQEMTAIEPQNTKWQLELSYAFNNLGTLYFNNESYKKAELKFNKSAQIKQKLVNKHPNNSQFIAELADTISWQASIYNKSNQLLDSLNMTKTSLELVRQLNIIEPENTIWKQRLGQAYFRLALKNYDFGNLNRAYDLISTSLPIFIQLHHTDKINQNWLKELANNYLLLAKINQHQDKLDDAIVNLNKVATHVLMYSQETQNMKDIIIQKFDYSTTSCLVLLALGKPKAATSQFNEVMEILGKFKGNDETNKMFFIAYSKYIQAQIQLSNNLDELAITTLVQARNYSDQALKYKPKNKEFMALNVAINNATNNKIKDQEMIDFLKMIEYKNPDYF